MHQKQPRIQVSLDPAVKSSLSFLAEHRHQSLSQVAGDLIEKALELEEDFYFSQLGERRLKELKQPTVAHDDVWQ
jgi:predicted DNA-binding protein